MHNLAAIRIALGIVHVPSRLPSVRMHPLPDGMPLLLFVLTGDEPSAEVAAFVTESTVEQVRDAARFFSEQVLFHPDSDAYRVLGVRPEASAADIRRNLALLIRWLHPDTAAGRHDRSSLVTRLTGAWEQIKTPDRRNAYDLGRPIHCAAPAPDDPGSQRRQHAHQAREVKSRLARAGFARRGEIEGAATGLLARLLGRHTHKVDRW